MWSHDLKLRLKRLRLLGFVLLAFAALLEIGALLLRYLAPILEQNPTFLLRLDPTTFTMMALLFAIMGGGCVILSKKVVF